MKSNIEIEAEQLEKTFGEYFSGVKIKKYVQKDCVRMILTGYAYRCQCRAKIRITYFRTACLDYLGYESWDDGGIFSYSDGRNDEERLFPYLDRAFEEIHKIFSRKKIDRWMSSSCDRLP